VALQKVGTWMTRARCSGAWAREPAGCNLLAARPPSDLDKIGVSGQLGGGSMDLC
jgi:hypothetical protein